jgi:flagellar motor switch protein FliG
VAVQSPPASDPQAATPAATPTEGADAPLDGRRKAAVLMATLGSDLAAEVMRHLRSDEIETLSIEIAKLGPIEEQTTEAILVEVVAAAASGILGDLAGGVEFAREILERTLGAERAELLLGRFSGTTDVHSYVHSFEFLRRTPPDQIVGFLRTEAPQTTALTVANLNTTLAAQVLARLPAETRTDIALRIARMGETSPSVIQQVEEVIRQKLTSVAEQEYSTAGGAKALADILNHADRSTERAVLDHLAATDQELAEEVRRLLFVFEDIVILEDRAIQQVLREADQKDLVLALRGVADPVKDKLLENMSERGAAMLKEEMEIQTPQRRRDVEAAQGRIVAVVRRLEEAGTIVIAGGAEDEEEMVV